MNTLHLISHTHWDREWYQTFQQFHLRLVHLVDGLLDILASDSAYQHFTLDGQTIVLEDYLQIRPEREADLRRYIQNGRILVGPWYILPDEFLVSPEATIRNLLEGDRIARQFGPKMMIGYIPDPFGHIGQMPQILCGFGIKTASLWRGVEDQPNEFWWQSPDGSRVLMGFLRQGYGNAASILNSSLDGFVAEVCRLRDQLAPHSSNGHILLMNGTDHQEAHPGTSAAVAYTEGKLNGDRLLHSTLPAYFAAVQADLDSEKLPEPAILPVVTGELRSPKDSPMLPAVLSARMWIKQRNRACETLLERWADPFSVWAQVYASEQFPAAGLRRPEGVLRQAWRLLMQCHPHDSICGCSIDQVHDEMRPRFDQVDQLGEEITRQSLEALAGTSDTRPPEKLEGQPLFSAITVFNPTAGPRTDSATVFIEAPADGGEFDLLDENGIGVPFQNIGMGSGEMFNMTMDRKNFQDIINMISPGMSVGEGKILGVKARRQGNEVEVDVQLGQIGEPDLAEWERWRSEIMELLKDPAINTYHMNARSVSSRQVLISARDIPGFGYRTYWVCRKDAAQKPPTQLSPLARALMPIATRLVVNPLVQKLMQRMNPDPAARPPYRIENEYFVVEAQPDGTLNVQDKGRGMVYQGQNRFVDGGDRGDEYNFSPPETDRFSIVRLKSVRVEKGAVQQILVMALEMDAPESLALDRKMRGLKTVILPITSRVTLTTGVARVDIHTEIENHASDHRLRVHFAAPFTVKEADYDGHFEVVRRPLALPAFDDAWVEQPRPEVPQRAFTAISDGKAGLLVANRGLPEVETLIRNDGNAEIAVTLLRCVGWLSRDDFPERKGAAGPVMPTPGAQLKGAWVFDYAIVPFSESSRMAAYHQAYDFQAPLRVERSAIHDGSLPPEGAFVQVEPAEFVISTVKAAEDGRGWLVRGYNISQKPLMVTLKTLKPAASAERVNMAEERLATLIPGADGEFSLDVRPHEVISVVFGNR